jgi:glutathione S-transferase
VKIVLGNKKYSSWSLRPWLALKLTGAPFEEIVVALDMDDTDRNIRKYSPSGRVPALLDGSITVWDTISICEYLNEKFPQAQLWPADSAQRAHARSIVAEMHSGFANLRNDCAMRIHEKRPMKEFRPETKADIQRVTQIWSDCLSRYGGPFLFGKRPTIADCFYAPVVSRFVSYEIPGGEKYVETIWNWAPLKEWAAAAREEKLVAPKHL